MSDIGYGDAHRELWDKRDAEKKKKQQDGQNRQAQIDKLKDRIRELEKGEKQT